MKNSSINSFPAQRFFHIMILFPGVKRLLLLLFLFLVFPAPAPAPAPARLASPPSSFSLPSLPLPLPMSSLPFPASQNPAAPLPSPLWAPHLRFPPLPTNAAWLNFVLDDGSLPEYIHPYLIQSKDGALSISYPSRIVQPAFIIQSFVPDLTITSGSFSASSTHMVTDYDDLSVTLRFEDQFTVPLVRGCPYVTFVFDDPVDVIFSTVHAVLDFIADEVHTKHKIKMNNGQTWLIYSSSALNLSSDLTVSHPFAGTIRVALLAGTDVAERILDSFRSSYPLRGHAYLSTPFEVKYAWDKVGEGQLLMLSLPIHRDLLYTLEGLMPDLSYNSIDGEMEGVIGDSWILNEIPISVGWYSLKGIFDSASQKMISDALDGDVAGLKPVTTDSSYFYGKAVARAARMALIAEEMGRLELVDKLQEYLEQSLTPWMEGTFSGNGFLYDENWGGLTTRNGANNAAADFGFGVYNDHHYHLGYFCYAGAVLAKLNASWGALYKPHLYTMVEDYMTIHAHHTHHPKLDTEQHCYHQYIGTGQHRAAFPRLRNFDLWVLHSWAGGVTAFADGRNQESTSEAVNAYYSAALVGMALGDDHLINTGLTLAALEMRAARALWHVPSNSTTYESEFVDENRIVGVLWANKRDTGLWFAPAEWRECRLGIQLLPILPISEILFKDTEFVQELVNWTLPALSRNGVTDGWKGFVYSLQAIYSPDQALANALTLSEHDDGNSLSNILWWIFSRW